MNHKTEEIIEKLEDRSFEIFADYKTGHIYATRRRNHIEVEQVNGHNRYIVNRKMVNNLYQALAECEEAER